MTPGRLLFVLPGKEAWLRDLIADLVAAAASLGVECLFLSEGPAPRDCGGTWVELDGLEKNPAFRRLIAAVPQPEVPETVVEREYRYCRARFGTRFNRGEVKQRFQTWMRQARALFRLLAPDRVWIWNGMAYRAAAFAAVARETGVPPVFAEKGVLPDSWILDDAGVNAASSLAGMRPEPVTAERVAAMAERINAWDGAGRSAWRQPGRMTAAGLEDVRRAAAGRRVVFFPGQVDSDSNIICFSPQFSGSMEALDFLLDNLGEKFFFLVKPHPRGSLSARDYRRRVRERGRVEPSIHVLDAVAASDLVATINSTVGVEAALRGRPVLLMGRSILTGQPFVREWDPGKKLENQVAEWMKEYAAARGKMTQLALAWAADLRDRRCLFLGDRAGLRARLQIEMDRAAPREQGPAVADMAALLAHLSPGERTAGLSGRELLGLAWRRLRRALTEGKGDAHGPH